MEPSRAGPRSAGPWSHGTRSPTSRGSGQPTRGCDAGSVVTSDLRRAVETAEIIATRLALPLTEEPRLRERRLGVAEGRPAAELWVPGAGGADRARVVEPDAAPEGGESIRQLLRGSRRISPTSITRDRMTG